MSLQVGVGRATVTPTTPVQMSGFAARVGPSRGAADDLQARALAVRDEAGTVALVLTVDAIGVDAGFTRDLRRRLADQVGADGLAVAATHTHGGPALLPCAYLGEAVPAVREAYLTGAAEAAGAALKAMAPARLRSGRVRVPGVAHNRRRPGGTVDDELLVVWAVDDAGTVRAILASFALHPVVLGPDNLLLTRDYVGYVVDSLEAHFPGATALFATGCAGQVNHGHRAAASFSLRRDPSRTFAAAEAIGNRLAHAASGVVEGGGRAARRVDVALARRRLHLPLRPRSGVEGDHGMASEGVLAELAEALRAARAGGDEAAACLLEPQVRWAERGLGWSPTYVATELTAMRLGDVVLAFMPGEPFVEYALALKDAAVTRYPEGTVVVPVAYANDAPGYIPTAEAVREGGYEVDLAYRFYGLPGRYSERVERHFLRAALRLVRQVT